MPNARKAPALTSKQLGLIHVAKARLGLEDHEYRELLESVAGVRSAKALKPRDFPFLMERFAELGFVSDFAARSYGHRRDMATPAQVEYIRQLWKDCHGGELDEAHLGNWLYRQFKVSALRFVDCHTARQAIKALLDWNRKRAEKGA